MSVSLKRAQILAEIVALGEIANYLIIGATDAELVFLSKMLDNARVHARVKKNEGAATEPHPQDEADAWESLQDI